MIYFIKSKRFVKIGYTAKEPEKRLAQLQTGNPETLKLLGTIEGTPEVEKALHNYFNRFHFRGEWFCIKGELQMCLGVSFVDNYLKITEYMDPTPLNFKDFIMNGQRGKAIKAAKHNKTLDIIIKKHLAV